MSSDVQRTSTSVQRPLEWMRFEPVKFGYLVDELSRSQVGTVMKLILRIWEFGPMLEDTVRTVSGVDFEVVRTRMLEVDGKLSFEMVEDARSYGKRTRNQRVEAGIASAEKRAANSTTVQRPFNDRSTGVLSMSVSDDLEERERAKPKDGFDDFYAPYPIKKARGSAEKAWAKLTKAERALCRPAIEAQVKACHFRGTDGKDYIPHPATWLNERRWLDEVSTSPASLAPAAPLTKEQARERLVQIRIDNNIGEGGAVPVSLMPKEVRDIIWR